MTVNQHNLAHIIVITAEAWGHARTACTLASRMVRLRPVTVTVFTACAMYDNIVSEIARNFEDGEDVIRSRVRVVGFSCQVPVLIDEASRKLFARQFRMVLSGEPVSCAKQEVEYPGWQSPCAVIVDVMSYNLLATVSAAVRGTVSVFAWIPVSLRSVPAILGPYTRTSRGELQAKVDAVMADTGCNIYEAAHKIITTPTDAVERNPGLPPMYNYEHYPQKMKSTIGLYCAAIYLTSNALLHECDGVISASAELLEPAELVQHFRDFLGFDSRKLHMVGPLIPTSNRAAKVETEQASQSDDVMGFLDRILADHGERSLVLVSFGTVFWTSEPEKVWAFLDVLIDRRIPFIMSHAVKESNVPDDVMERSVLSGIGCIVPWIPQQAVLSHPATAWFVTHGGFNGTTEAIHAGIPMICWPFYSDQAVNTIHLTDNLDVAYELLEVRSADGLRPILRTGKTPLGTLEAARSEAHSVLANAFGEDGKKKRENILKLKAKSALMWEEGGAGLMATERLLDSVLQA